jgi:quercetin dioxygenase-like cupin family protein
LPAGLGNVGRWRTHFRPIRMLSVHFAPGGRTAWHHHPFGQILHVTEGEGLVQRRGGGREPIRAGDTVLAGAGEWHWHGAAAAAR